MTDDQVLVDLKYFAQGVIDRENLSNDPDFNMKEEIQPGDLLTATVIQTDDGEGNVVLSRKEANDRMTWEHFRQLLDERTPLEVTISEVVNGGAVAMVEGVRGFIPASRLDAAYVEDLDSWNGKKIPVLVIEADEEKKRLVLSGRELAREKQDAEKKSRIARCQRLRRSLEKSAVLDQNQTPLAEKWHRVRQTDQLVHIQPFSLEIIVVHRIIARDRRPQLLFITLLQKRLFAV